ncbi:DUF6883 domain-containing protein [uncultured Acidaminococcus sp.]|uniref:DUF6883 domain-containing protein n=1 Tax=uncultured Acidaminococcus sp. TaxID=352152 RepID=UPI0029421612|nr:DUF6883 domain-containing protein [uncultured Acidaminococcus sp.]
MDELQRQLKAFSKRYGFQGQMMKARIEILIKQGKSPEEAIRQVFKEYGVEEWLQANVSSVIVGTVQDALGQEMAKDLPAAALLEALSNPWDGSGLTLSEKIHGASNTMLNDVIATVRKQIHLNKTVKNTAQALYDGYRSGHVVRQQELPKYMDELTRWTRRSRENLSEAEVKDLQRAIRKVQAQAEDLVDDSSTYNHFRTALNNLFDKLDHGSEKAAERALQAAIEEKSRYVAERIARTEAARARYDAFIARYGEDDSVVAYRWKLGSRHPAEDICDMYAHADLYGLGAGVFPKDQAPVNPAHPHCLCHYAPVYASELKGKKRSDNVEDRGNAWLKRQPLHIRQAILGVKGEQEWKAGRVGWMEKARNISPVFEKKESRLEKLILQLHSKKLIVIVRPNAFDDSRKVVIPEGKLVNYCLNKNHPDGGPKAVAFEKYLGYTQSDSKKLENLIRNNLGKAKYYDRGNNGYGNQYSAVFKTSSLDGKEISLITGWIIKKGEKYPKMTTAYLKPELKVMQL